MKLNVKSFLFLSLLIFSFFSKNIVFAEVFWDIPFQKVVKSANDSKIACDSLGKNVYIAYSSITLNIIRSSDYAKSFSDPIKLGFGVASAQVTTDSTGKYVYVAWIEDKKLFSSASSDFGQTFIDPVELYSCSSESLIQNPKIFTNAEGNMVYALWVDSYNQICFRASDDYGARFSDVKYLVKGSYPNLVTDQSGKNIFISFESDSIQVISSSDYGKSFSKPNTLAKTGENQKIIASENTQNLYVIWEDESNNVELSATSDFGKNWYSPLKFSTNCSTSIDLTTNSSGEYVYFVCTDENENICLKVSSDSGKGFSTIDLKETGKKPKVITDSSGKYVFLVWIGSDNTLKFRSSNNFGINFEPATSLIDDLNSMFLLTDIVIDAKGRFIHILSNPQGDFIKIIDGARLLSNNDN